MIVALWIVLVPLLLAPAPEPWPQWGAGGEWQSGWHYDWGPNCTEVWHVPMAWAVEAVHCGGSCERAVARCNDGRPLLVLNEPERAEQANTSPEIAAALVARLAVWWEGPLWCCGQSATAVEWTAAFVRVYRERYGSLPLAGWHIHVYANDTLRQPITAQEFRSLTEPWRAEAALRNVDAFRARFGGRIIISEMGALTADYWHQPTDLMPLMRAFRAGIERRPWIESAAWFAAYETQQFAPSNLLTADGGLSVLGREWR